MVTREERERGRSAPLGPSPLLRLQALGQSPWLDHIERGLIETGELAALIERWGLGGLTSNPSIFAAAFAASGRYDADIARFTSEGATANEIYDRLVLADIQAAAAAFLPVYERTGRLDGYVSVELSPYLANDRDATVAEAERLAQAVRQPNVMIKVPATEAGVAALPEVIGQGINVNATLLFSPERYGEVADAYLDGLERAAVAGVDLARVASVASFFVSRIDAALDPKLELIVAERSAGLQVAKALRGRIAIASAKRAYAMYERRRSGKRFARLAAKGARPQRLLWASTSTKNAQDSDVKYVEALIGAETVNTIPLPTLRAYDDHGVPEARLRDDLAGAAGELKRLGALGIDLAEATERLLDEGVAKFREAYDAAIAAIERKRLTEGR